MDEWPDPCHPHDTHLSTPSREALKVTAVPDDQRRRLCGRTAGPLPSARHTFVHTEPGGSKEERDRHLTIDHTRAFKREPCGRKAGPLPSVRHMDHAEPRGQWQVSVGGRRRRTRKGGGDGAVLLYHSLLIRSPTMPPVVFGQEIATHGVSGISETHLSE